MYFCTFSWLILICTSKTRNWIIESVFGKWICCVVWIGFWIQFRNWMQALGIHKEFFVVARFMQRSSFVTFTFIVLEKVLFASCKIGSNITGKWMLYFIHYCINPFQTSVPFLYPLWSSENQRFSVIFRGYK